MNLQVGVLTVLSTPSWDRGVLAILEDVAKDARSKDGDFGHQGQGLRHPSPGFTATWEREQNALPLYQSV